MKIEKNKIVLIILLMSTAGIGFGFFVSVIFMDWVMMSLMVILICHILLYVYMTLYKEEKSGSKIEQFLDLLSMSENF